jgi:geranylgeranyl reductase family protein
MNEYNVVVAGGGPVGGHIAKKITKKGHKLAILEEHQNIGTPLKCAGLVTPRILKFLDFSEPQIIQNKVYGAHIYSPSGDMLAIGDERVHALVINRSKFDKYIINSAKNSGADVFLKSKVTDAKKRKNNIEIEFLQNGEKNKLNCSLVIGSDGAHSLIRNVFNFPSPKEYLYGIGAEVENVNLDPKYVKIFLGKNIAPGFFSWIIPLNKNGSEARIGLCVESNSKNKLKQYFSNLIKLNSLRNSQIIRYIGGSVPLGPLKKTAMPNVMLVGDAAAQVKPTSGGGIYPGLLSASCCSSVALEALELNDFSTKILNKYHKLWSKKIGKELSLGMKFRSIFKELTDDQLDKYIKKFNNKKTIDIIGKYGDIDYPSKLILPLLKNFPSLVKLLPSILK